MVISGACFVCGIMFPSNNKKHKHLKRNECSIAAAQDFPFLLFNLGYCKGCLNPPPRRGSKLNRYGRSCQCKELLPPTVYFKDFNAQRNHSLQNRRPGVCIGCNRTPERSSSNKKQLWSVYEIKWSKQACIMCRRCERNGGIEAVSPVLKTVVFRGTSNRHAYYYLLEALHDKFPSQIIQIIFTLFRGTPDPPVHTYVWGRRINSPNVNLSD